MSLLSAIAPSGQSLAVDQVRALVSAACPAASSRGQRLLLVVPDNTRTAPVGLLFQCLWEQLATTAAAFDVLIALGTHQPMSEEAICRRLDLTIPERQGRYRNVRFFNHDWANPSALRHIGTISAEEIRSLSQGLFAMEVPVEINQRLFDYDQIIIVGPVFPHEVVGFSGGNKYLFPGVAGPQILNFFHWLGAVITTPRIIGHPSTPVRQVIDRAAALVTVPKLCFSLVVNPPPAGPASPGSCPAAVETGLAGLFYGTPEAAWEQASNLSRQCHLVVKDRPFHTIIACAPTMYDEIWTAGKCMYKLEPVLADDGELVIYAPHIHEFSVTHGRGIREIGYHCRDYFLRQWDRFKDRPWGVLAHSTHVHGLGTFDDGVERPRARVTLATGIPEADCRAVNLGYRNPAELRLEEFAGREDEGILLVPKAGEIVYQLKDPPPWAR
ncbi:MAG: lactate racemase domain-containing protein [Limisphaerales bacterium]